MSSANPQQEYLKLLQKNHKLRKEINSLDRILNSYKDLNKLSTKRISELETEYSQLTSNLLSPMQKSLSTLSILDPLNASSTFISTNLSRSNSLKKNFAQDLDSLLVFDQTMISQSPQKGFFFSFHLIAPLFNNGKYSKENQGNLNILKPSIIFSFPEGGVLEEGVRSKILELALLGRCKYKKLDLNESVANQISEVIYQAHYRDGNSFVVKIDGKENDEDNGIYGCFVNFEDLGNGFKGEQAILPVFYCILSYYPCFELHFTILNRMLDLKRTSRCDMTQIFLETGDVSVFFLEDFISYEEIALLNKYYSHLSQNSLDQGLSISIPLDSVESIEYEFPTDLKLLDQLWFCPMLFSSLKLSNFYLIFCAILQEKSIVFFSTNLDLLTSSILAFNSLLQPFQWQHSLIPILTKSEEKLISQSKPFVIGINHKHKTFLRKNKYWYVNLDKGRIRPCCAEYTGLKINYPFSHNLEEFIKEYYVQLFDCICYTPNDYQIGLTKSILNEIFKFNCWVIESITSYCRSKDIMNFQIHKEIIRLNSGNDKDFLVSVFETDMFKMYNY